MNSFTVHNNTKSQKVHTQVPILDLAAIKGTTTTQTRQATVVVGKCKVDSITRLWYFFKLLNLN